MGDRPERRAQAKRRVSHRSRDPAQSQGTPGVRPGELRPVPNVVPRLVLLVLWSCASANPNLARLVASALFAEALRWLSAVALGGYRAHAGGPRASYVVRPLDSQSQGRTDARVPESCSRLPRLSWAFA